MNERLAAAFQQFITFWQGLTLWRRVALVGTGSEFSGNSADFDGQVEFDRRSRTGLD